MFVCVCVCVFVCVRSLLETTTEPIFKLETVLESPERRGQNNTGF